MNDTCFLQCVYECLRKRNCAFVYQVVVAQGNCQASVKSENRVEVNWRDTEGENIDTPLMQSSESLPTPSEFYI